MPLSADERRLLNEIHASQARLEVRMDESFKDIEDLQRIVYGNGRPGLKADVREMQTVLRIVRFVASASFVASLGVAASILVGA